MVAFWVLWENGKCFINRKKPVNFVDRLVSGKFNYAINYARVTLPLRMQRVQT